MKALQNAIKEFAPFMLCFGDEILQRPDFLRLQKMIDT